MLLRYMASLSAPLALLLACGGSTEDASTSTSGSSSSSSSSSSSHASSSSAGGAATSSSASTTDSASSSSAASSTSSGAGGGGGAPDGMPIVAPSDTWTWVDFPDSMCADGSATGIGINPSSTGSDVLVYLEGGGACWDYLTCYQLMTADNISNGYGASDFQADAASELSVGFFDRTQANNPFKDYSYVYIPYCTGDVHAGDVDATYNGKPTHHHGLKNVKAFLNRLVPTFPKAGKVVLAGSSAGGFGAALDYWRAQDAWGSVPVYLVDDSGPPMESMYITDQATWTKAWNLEEAIPAGCAQCVTDYQDLIGYYDATYGRRSALLSYTEDSVIPTYFMISESEFEMGLDQVAMKLDTTKSFKYFFVDGMSHVLLFTPGLTTNGVTLNDWLTKMVNDDASWTSEKP